MKSIKTYNVIIIGAGLTGLTTAFYLKKAGFSVAIIEKSNHTGGVIQTVKNGAFLYEKGPNTGVVSKAAVVDLFEQLKTDCQIEIANPKAKRRLIWKNDQWIALPSGPNAITTPLFTLKDKFRVLVEPFRKKGDNPNENLADFVKRRLGKSILDYAVDPFVSGVYAGDTELLIPKYALPKLYQLEQEYGSLIKGTFAKRSIFKEEKANGISKEVFSVEGGLQSLTDALAKNIGSENIFLNAKETLIEKEANTYSIQFKNEDNSYNFSSTNVISTVGSYALSDLFPFISKTELKNIETMIYAKVIQVNIGFNEWKGQDILAFGGLVPTVEQKDILGVLFTSSFFKNRAPKNGALLSVFMGGIKKPDFYELPDDEIKKIVSTHLNEMFAVEMEDAHFVEIQRYRNAIPQYDIQTPKKLSAILDIEKKHKGLLLAGGIRDGIGMADRITQAKTIAEELINKRQTQP